MLLSEQQFKIECYVESIAIEGARTMIYLAFGSSSATYQHVQHWACITKTILLLMALLCQPDVISGRHFLAQIGSRGEYPLEKTNSLKVRNRSCWQILPHELCMWLLECHTSHASQWYSQYRSWKPVPLSQSIHWMPASPFISIQEEDEIEEWQIGSRMNRVPLLQLYADVYDCPGQKHGRISGMLYIQARQAASPHNITSPENSINGTPKIKNTLCDTSKCECILS